MKNKKVFGKIWYFIKGWFVRETRIERALKIALALKAFMDSEADDVVVYVLSFTSWGSYASKVQSVLENNLPEIVDKLEIMDVADEGSTKEECAELIVAKMLEKGEIEDKAKVLKIIAENLEDGKFSAKETKAIYKYIKKV